MSNGGPLSGDRGSEALALYFGDRRDSGHFLHNLAGRTTLDPDKWYAEFPWSITLLDTGLLKNGRVPDCPNGRVYWTCGGAAALWYAFTWWDRSGDARPGSNSGFYVRGFGVDQAREAFAFSCRCWPDIVQRQRHALVLVDRCSDTATPAAAEHPNADEEP